MIYISTGQFFDLNFVKSSQIINSLTIKNIELSCGKYIKNYRRYLNLLAKNNNLMLHNYFPRPKKDFVINLSSQDKHIRNKSFNHIVKCINLCGDLNLKLFSFHAGFLFDPSIKKIGKNYEKVKLFRKKRSLNTFIKLSNKLSKIAKKRDVKLLIENNVISKSNYLRFKENPFLMTDIKDTIYIMNQTDKNIGLLTDLAHLKVSAKTLNFSKVDFLKKTSKWNFGYHLSDNKGIEDTNDKIRVNSWFWKHINKKLDYYTLEVKFKNRNEVINQYKLLKKKLNYA